MNEEVPTVLITGASRGIGKAAAKTFAEAGWNLLMIARTESALIDLAKDLKTKDNKIFYKSLDLSSPSDISSGIQELLGNGITPDVLINNAGVAWTGDLLAMTLVEWNWIMQMNLTSVFQVCSEVVPSMREKGGLIINVSSHASRNIFPQWGAYCVTKAALSSFTKCLANEESKNLIRACTLTLGSVNTTLWDTKTVQSDFPRDQMLSENEVALQLLYMARQPSTHLIEDITLMPTSGAF